MRVEPELKSRISPMKVSLLITMLLTGVGPSASAHKPNPHRKVAAASDTGSLTLGNLLLVPILASLGIKLLALLPIVFSKLLLLTTLSFLSSNLSLLISVFVGVRNLWLLEQRANVNVHDQEYLRHHDQAAVPQRAAEQETQEDPGKKAESADWPSSRLDRRPVGSKCPNWRRRHLRGAIDAKKKLLSGEGFATPGPSHRDPFDRVGRRKIELRYLNGRFASFL